jgi:hypothetical protein
VALQATAKVHFVLEGLCERFLDRYASLGPKPEGA